MTVIFIYSRTIYRKNNKWESKRNQIKEEQDHNLSCSPIIALNNAQDSSLGNMWCHREVNLSPFQFKIQSVCHLSLCQNKIDSWVIAKLFLGAQSDPNLSQSNYNHFFFGFKWMFVSTLNKFPQSAWAKVLSQGMKHIVIYLMICMVGICFAQVDKQHCPPGENMNKNKSFHLKLLIATILKQPISPSSWVD